MCALSALACSPRPRPKSATPAPAQATSFAVATDPRSNEEELNLPSLSAKWGPVPELGVAVEPYHLAVQGDVIAKHFRRLVAINSMKWSETCPAENRCDWKKADTIADFARQHSMKMTGHTFVWHQMYPAWLFKDGNGAAPKALVIERLSKHIHQMVERYADVVDNWDVVNEAISDKSNQMWRQQPEQSRWFEAFGSAEYVEIAFRLAAEAAARFAPSTKLYYNDYSIENADKRKKVIEMVRSLRNKGVRIDGIGIQGHINLEWPNVTELTRAIEEFAREKLSVKFSELDISVYTEDDFDKKSYQHEVAYDAALEERLARRYSDVFAVFRQKADSLSSVTLWGISDDSSWLNGWPIGRKNFPLLFDRNHRPKLAMKRLLGI